MKVVYLCILSSLCLFNVYAQVGKVELVADILPGPGNASPQILGVVNNELIIGERLNDSMNSHNVMYRVDSTDNFIMIGKRDSSYTFHGAGYCVSNKVYALARLGSLSSTVEPVIWDGSSNLPRRAIDSIIGPNGRIYTEPLYLLNIGGIIPNQEKLLINFWADNSIHPNLFPISISDYGFQAVLDLDSSVAYALPAFYYQRFPYTPVVYQTFPMLHNIPKMVAIDTGLAMILEYHNEGSAPQKPLYITSYLASYQISEDSIVMHDFSTVGFSHSEYDNRFMDIQYNNGKLFLYTKSNSINCYRWFLFNNNSIQEVPSTRTSTSNFNGDRSTINYIDQKYYMAMYDSLDNNAWFGSYDPQTNTSHRIFNFRVIAPYISSFTYYAGDYYFRAVTPQPSSNIFVFDGVNPPTLLDNIAQNVNITDARDFHVYNGSLYFSATDSLYGHQYGRELFKYTSPKAAIVKDVEPNAIRTLQVYPNPTNGVLQLEGLPNNAGTLQFQLYNTQGQRLDTWEESINNTSYTVPTSKLANLAMGTYFIQVKSTQAPTTYLASFIKE